MALVFLLSEKKKSYFYLFLMSSLSSDHLWFLHCVYEFTFKRKRYLESESMHPALFHLLRWTMGVLMSFGRWYFGVDRGPCLCEAGTGAMSLALSLHCVLIEGLTKLLILVLYLLCSPSRICVYALGASATV